MTSKSTPGLRAEGKDRGTAAPSGAARSVVLGTAGHIDHGKTALVLALTGVDADRLPEEKARGITIDLGFAAMALTGPQGQSLDVSLIDVPGHHAFIRNMLAGAGGIDAVMLIVAADEGVKAQTREHLQICRLLGIRHGLIVLTKQDAVGPERLLAARAEVVQLVEGSFLQGAPVLSVSARNGEGLGPLKVALGRLLSEMPPRDDGQIARLPVDRAFSMRGFGTVVTGTLQAGALRAGVSLTLQPGERKVRVRGVQVHGEARAEVFAPNRVALNLAGVEVAEVERGDTLVPEATLEPVSVLDVALEGLPGAPGMRHRQRVRVHAFASEALATLLVYEGTDAPGERQLGRLRLAKPMLLVPGDRFVLRQPSPAATLGGGRVLDAYPLQRIRKAATAKWLRSLETAEPAEMVLSRVQRRGADGLTYGRLVAETGWSRAALQRGTGPLVRAGRLYEDTGTDSLIASEALASTERRVLQEVVNAREKGISRAELRSRVGLSEWVLARAVTRLEAARRVMLRGDLLRVPEQKAAPGERQADGRLAELEKIYREARLASPLVSEVAERLRLPAAAVREPLTTLLRTGKLVRLGSDNLLVHRDALQQLVAQLAQKRGQRLDVGQFKELTGLSRKHAIPLLEYLDGARVTRKTGGVREVL